MRKTPDLAHQRIVILLHEAPWCVLGAERIVLIYIDFPGPLREYLPGELFLHPVDAVLMNQMIRV